MPKALPRRDIILLGASLASTSLLLACDRSSEGEPPRQNPEANPDATAKKGESEAHDAELLNSGILLEQGAINVYTAAAGLEFIRSDATVLKIAGQFMGHHVEHRDTLASLIEKLGGKPVDPETAKTPEIPAIILDESAEPEERKLATLRFARKLERQAAEAYHQLIVQQLQTDLARRSAVEILPTEAQHVAVYDLVLAAEAPVNAALFSEQS